MSPEVMDEIRVQTIIGRIILQSGLVGCYWLFILVIKFNKPADENRRKGHGDKKHRYVDDDMEPPVVMRKNTAD